MEPLLDLLFKAITLEESVLFQALRAFVIHSLYSSTLASLDDLD